MVSKKELIEKNLQRLGQGCVNTCSVTVPTAEFKCQNSKIECPDLSPGDKSGHVKFYAEISGIEKAKATVTAKVGSETLGSNSKVLDVGGEWWDPFDWWGMCGAKGPFEPRCHMDISFNRVVKPGETMKFELSWSKA